MLKLSKSSNPASYTPNLLPCKIHQDGPIDAPSRYWDPKIGEDGKPEAYFRGRKLKGREIKMPNGYRGVVVKSSGMEKEAARPMDVGVRDEEGGEEEDEELEEVSVLEEVGDFDGVVAWGHETLVHGDDAFVRGIEEWTTFSEAMHKPGDDGAQGQKQDGDAKP